MILEFIQPVFETLSPEMITLPLMYLMAEKAPYDYEDWPPDNGSSRPPPPQPLKPKTTQQLLDEYAEIAKNKFDSEIFRTEPKFPIIQTINTMSAKEAFQNLWDKMRSEKGFEGDCTYPWERVINTPFAELIELQSNASTAIDLPPLDQIEKIIGATHSHPITKEHLDTHRKLLDHELERLDLATPSKISNRAAALGSDDLAAVRSWGKDADLARVAILKELKSETIHLIGDPDNEVSSANSELNKLFAAKKPSGLKAAFRKVLNFMPSASEAVQQDLDRMNGKLDYARMSEDEKKKAEAQLIERLEEAVRTTIDSEEDNIIHAEKAAVVVERYQSLLQTYRRSLSKNRTRILEETRPEKKKLAQDAIDDRIDALDESIEICEREKLHYESLMELHAENKRQYRAVVNHSIEALRNFERIEQQVKLTRNISAAGQFAQNLQGMAYEKQLRIIKERLAQARSQEVERISTLRQAMETDQTLVLDYKAPIALIEHQRTLALPAPKDEEEERAYAPLPNALD